MDESSIFDLKDEDDCSSCSSFTVATVLSHTKDAATSVNKRCSIFISSVDGTCAQLNTTVTETDEELQKLRSTSSLMDDSFDSTIDDIQQESERTIMSSPVIIDEASKARAMQESSDHDDLQKTVKKSNCNRWNSTIRDSKFNNPNVNNSSAKTSTRQQLKSTRAPLQAPYDEAINKSFEESIGNPLDTYVSFDELDRETKKRRKGNRCSNRFLSVYDEIASEAIKKSLTFESKKAKNSKAKKMSDAFATAVQSVTDSLSYRTAANVHCSVGDSWGNEEIQSLSGKKRHLTDISGNGGLQKLIQAWGSNHHYVQMQLLAERNEERCHDQQLKNYTAQIKYLQHENLCAYESVKLARTESITANETKKEVEEERNELRKEVNDCQKECSTMKEAMIALAEAEKYRVKTINRLERKLQRAKTSLDKATTSAQNAEKEAATLRETIDKLLAENNLLSFELNDKKNYIKRECNIHTEKLMTAKKEAKKWQLEVEENCNEIKMLQMKLATAQKSSPHAKSTNNFRTPNHNGIAKWGLINAFGAEEITVGSELFNQQTFVEKQPLKTAIMSPLDQSSRQLLYSASAGKENQPNVSMRMVNKKVHLIKQQQKCCLCFKNTAGVMKSCQCSQKHCDKQAHVTCLSKYKVGNISTCVSHPGTPLPPMPLILCAGLWGSVCRVK